ncbi:MAG: YeaH/YhbH family protein [Gammaproteobacteria bacterium]|nr:YeaH/YhbH family protein [Gammaproteobacteria bacterium]
MTQFIDRRLNGKNKSMVNRQRFIRRFKNQIKKAVSEAISGRSITNIEQGEVINIPTKSLTEPKFNQGRGGVYEQVFPSNKHFTKGDKIKRPGSESARKNNGSNAGNSDNIGEDNFVFEISREEFLELFFDDLELPNLIKKQLHNINIQKKVRAGYTSVGVPTNINIIRSMRRALGRKKALTGAHHQKSELLEQELQTLEKITHKSEEDLDKIISLKKQINQIKTKIANIPFIDSIDIKYNNKITLPSLSAGAVMFCVMDVSGSMDEAKKDIAKRFFILLYLFLTRTYEKIDVVFIRHHTSAKEVNEEEFFYSKETGGTVVSSALELMNDIIHSRYSAQEWNIYAAQASDGDNWNNDSPRCHDLIINSIMPNLQHFSYIEIMPRHHQSLWEAYSNIANQFSNFSMQHIKHYGDIYPVFRSLFKKQAKSS